MIFVDILLIVSVAWLVITQVIIPVVRGSRLFPAFSKQAATFADEAAALDQEIEAERLRYEVQQKRQQLDKDKHFHDTHI